MQEEDFPDDEEIGELSLTFGRATDFVTSNASVMQQDDLLYLYGRYKQVHSGKCTQSMPGILKFRSRSKWSAWHDLGNMTKNEAMQQYITRVKFIVPDWDSDAEKSAKKAPKSQFGLAPSILQKTDEELSHESKTSFDFVKEGDLKSLKNVTEESSLKDLTDENGMSLLHWACDRGHMDIVQYLMSDVGVDVNMIDNFGQVPLHYASSCGHGNVIACLLKHGASRDVFDADGLTPVDVAFNSDIKLLLDASAV